MDSACSRIHGMAWSASRRRSYLCCKKRAFAAANREVRVRSCLLGEQHPCWGGAGSYYLSGHCCGRLHRGARFPQLQCDRCAPWRPSACCLLLCLRPTGRLVSPAHDENIKAWDAARTASGNFPGHSGAITEMCVSPCNRWLASSSIDGTIRVWNLIDSHQKRPPLTVSGNGERTPVNSISFASQSPHLVHCHRAGFIRIHL